MFLVYTTQIPKKSLFPLTKQKWSDIKLLTCDLSHELLRGEQYFQIKKKKNIPKVKHFFNIKLTY